MNLQAYEALTDILNIGLAIADLAKPGLPLLAVNDAFCKLTGYAREEALGRNCRFLQGPESDVGTVRKLGRAIRRRESIHVEIINYRKDGSKFWNSLSIAPLPDADGRVTRIVGVQRDISEIKAQQREQATAHRLAALGELAGGIAHDFNNLLSVVVGGCDLLEEQGLGDASMAEPLQAVRAAANRGADHVRRLLTLTRAPLHELEAVDLGSLCEELRLMLRGTLAQDVKLQLQIVPDAQWVLGDATQLEAALLNLVLNARNAMPQGGSIQIVSKRQTRGSRSWVLLSVRDDGRGMDEATMARIFDPRFTTGVDGKGHGFGLAMVHAYVQGVGGHVSVKSAPGRGSRFVLRLPACLPPPRVLQPPPPQAALVGSGRNRALLVEDDDVLRFTSQSMLELLGYAVVACASAEQAMSSLDQQAAFDLVMTDHLLGGAVTGADLAVQLRQRLPQLPIIISSGWTGARLVQHDSDAFLPKPFTLQQLQQAIALAHNRIHAGVEQAPGNGRAATARRPLKPLCPARTAAGRSSA